MNRTFYILFVILVNIEAFGQQYEGKITYRNAYTSKIPGVSDAQLTQMMGDTQEYYIKDGNYKSVTNGTFFQWQLYINRDNIIYNKMANSDTLMRIAAGSNADEVLSTTINQGVTTVLGYTCDEIILTCKSGTQKYYFDQKLAIDPMLFREHLYGNWYALVSHSKAIPLRAVIENQQFLLINTAVAVTPSELDSEIFSLNANMGPTN
jgi:hypothetical protein